MCVRTLHLIMVRVFGWLMLRGCSQASKNAEIKLYAESFRAPDHLAATQEQARATVAAAIGG